MSKMQPAKGVMCGDDQREASKSKLAKGLLLQNPEFQPEIPQKYCGQSLRQEEWDKQE
jgi:hypothetical protein